MSAAGGWVDPLGVRCPTCGSSVRVRCWRFSGYSYGTHVPLRRMHPARYAAARERERARLARQLARARARRQRRSG